MRNTTPTKLITAGALIFNEQDEFLLVKPSYKETWEIPGGIVESDESPFEACKREILEEIGIGLEIKYLLSVVYSERTGGQTDKLQFIFNGGVVSDIQKSIRLDMKEIIDFRFVTFDQAKELLNNKILSRVKHALLNRDVAHNTFSNLFEIVL